MDNKRRIDGDISQRLADKNSAIFEKQQSLLEQRQESFDIATNCLSEIEDKLEQTTYRKQAHLDEISVRSRKHSIDIQEKLKKLNHNRINDQKKFIHKIATKMIRVYS